MSRYEEIDLGRVKTISIKDRQSKVETDLLTNPIPQDASFHDFWDSLPPILAAGDLKGLVEATASAVRAGKPVLLMMGAHVIKVGLSPVIIDLMEQGIVQAIAMNGAGAIHDVELAYFGKTSEDVASMLEDGRFGMVKETADLINETISGGRREDLGFGEAVGRRIVLDQPAQMGQSLFGRAYELNIPVTVHVAVGTDIIHQHPSADGAAIGELSLRDFRIFARLAADLGDGGVVILLGSSVILPEVFLKALTVARNIYGEVSRFTTANFDMIRHYRPGENVLRRPTQNGGTGYAFTGHHEIMIPLFAAGVKQALSGPPEG